LAGSALFIFNFADVVFPVYGRAAQKKQIRRHQRIMIYTYFLGLIVTGFFTLLPGRLMHHILLAGASQ
jgi:uncharacterized membrane protein